MLFTLFDVHILPKVKSYSVTVFRIFCIHYGDYIYKYLHYGVY